MRELKFGKVVQDEIKITPSHNNGFIVKAGCSFLAFESVDSLIASLAEYLKNPDKAKAEYLEAIIPEKAKEAVAWTPYKKS